MSAATCQNDQNSSTSLHGLTPVQALREDTGELLNAAGVSIEGLEGYARARHQRPALALELEELLQVLALDHPQLACVLADMAACDRTIERAEAQLAGAYAAEDRAGGTLRLDLPGVVAVTWPRPARRWTQRVKPERIAEMDPALARRLGIEQVTSAPAKPIIKVAEPSGRPAKVVASERGDAPGGDTQLLQGAEWDRTWRLPYVDGELMDAGDWLELPVELVAPR